MNAAEFLAAQPFIHSVGWTLIHFIWQGALLGGACAAAMAWCRNGSPELRYAIGVMTLSLMAAAPVVTLFVVQGPQPWLAEPSPDGAGWLVTAASAPDYAGWSAAAMPWLVGAWLVGVVTLALRFCGGWWRIQALRRTGVERLPAWIDELVMRLACEMRVPVPVQALLSSLVDTPTVIGWLRPVILLPASVVVGLTPQQLEMVIAHELGHVRRFDYLVNLVQVLIGTLLFYHPAVRWVSERVRHERENCCDDIALAHVGDAVAYARALAALETQRQRQGSLAMAATGGSLSGRIRRLFGRHHSQHGYARASWIAVVGAVLVLGATTLALRPLWLAPQDADDAVEVVEADAPAVDEPADADPAARPAVDLAFDAAPAPVADDDGMARDMARAADSIRLPAELPQPEIRVAGTLTPLPAPDAEGRDEVTPEPAAEPQARTTPEATRRDRPLPPTIETAVETVARLPGIELVHRTLPDGLHTPTPEYPATAARRGIAGAVTASYVVNPDGSVGGIEIIGEIGGIAFGEQVARTLASWRFEPPADGRDIAAVQTFHFTPSDETTAARECAVTGTRLCRQRRAWITDTERQNLRVISGVQAHAPQALGSGG